MNDHFGEEQLAADTLQLQNADRPISNLDETTAFSLFQSIRARLGIRAPYSEKKSTQQILANLYHPEWSVRVEAVRTLEALGTPALMDHFEILLHDENGLVRAAAARALGEQGQYDSTASLVAALCDVEWRVRASAALALGKLRKPISLGPLVQLLYDEDESVRATAVWALGQLETCTPVEILEVALHDKDALVRAAGVQALGKMNKPIPEELLTLALRDEDESVRATAMRIQEELKVHLTLDFSVTELASDSTSTRRATHQALNEPGAYPPMDCLRQLTQERGSEDGLSAYISKWKPDAIYSNVYHTR